MCIGFEFVALWTPPLGSWEASTCRSRWTRRLPKTPSLRYARSVCCSWASGDGSQWVRDSPGSDRVDKHERGNRASCASMLVGQQSFKGSVCLLPPETLPPLRNVRHGFRLAGSERRTWLLELSFCASISCLEGTKAHCLRVVWLHAA